jgi:uncharacterized protein (DUF427 family)
VTDSALEDLEIPAIDYGTEHIRLVPCPKRIRAFVGGVALVDTLRAQIMFEPGRLPVYYLPFQDVRTDLLAQSAQTTASERKGSATYWSVQVGGRTVPHAVWAYRQSYGQIPDLSGLMAVYWSAMDAWFEEEEEVWGHARDPHHRIEVLRSARHVRVALRDEILAETHRPVLLLESHLPARFYIPKLDVRAELLVPSATVSRCPYKGVASQWWSAADEHGVVTDVAWSYPAPTLECSGIANHICFFQERVDVFVDGELLPRPQTPWSL